MENKKLKKEFKKKCKKEKALCYTYTLTGTIISYIGLIIVMVTVFLDLKMGIFEFPNQIILYIIAIIAGAFGVSFELKGEKEFKKELNKYIKENEK